MSEQQSIIKQKTQTTLSKLILAAFLAIPLISSIISMFHLVEFFELGNTSWMALGLGISFEIGSIASLLTMTILDKIKSWMIYSIFIILVSLQIIGNVYFSFDYINKALIENVQWLNSAVELFSYIFGNDLQTIKIFLAFLIGTPIPLIALLFLKSTVDYLKPDNVQNKIIQENVTNTNTTGRRTGQSTKENIHREGTGYNKEFSTSNRNTDIETSKEENENNNKNIEIGTENFNKKIGLNAPIIVSNDDPEK